MQIDQCLAMFFTVFFAFCIKVTLCHFFFGVQATVVDNFSRGCLPMHAGKSLKGEDVVGVME
jgi:hypothetical protein